MTVHISGIGTTTAMLSSALIAAVEGEDVNYITLRRREAAEAFQRTTNICATQLASLTAKVIMANGEEEVRFTSGGSINFYAAQTGPRPRRCDLMIIDGVDLQDVLVYAGKFTKVIINEEISMADIITQTQQFMEGARQPFGVPLGDYEDGLRVLRRKILDEEWKEYHDGEKANDPVELADGAGDMIVVAAGTLFTYFGAACARDILDEIGRTNLSKVDGTFGPTVFREDGKVAKPEGFVAPNIKAILQRHGFVD